MKATIPLGRHAGVPIGAHRSALVPPVLLNVLLAEDILPVADPGMTAPAYWLTALAAAHTTTRLRDVARPLDQRSLVLVGEPIADVLRPTALRPGLDAMAVTENRAPVGILTGADVMRTGGTEQARPRPGEGRRSGTEVRRVR